MPTITQRHVTRTESSLLASAALASRYLRGYHIAHDRQAAPAKSELWHHAWSHLIKAGDWKKR
jgi:hypothetical protein